MILILGGGLAGLSTAYHLGETPHLVLEKEDRPGGLCRTRRRDGFRFDYTGHLLHLRHPRIVELVEELLPDGLFEQERRAVVHCRGRRLAYPFQANLHGLPPEVVARCLVDFARAAASPPPREPASFRDWALASFGEGICAEFLFPYNRKLFGREPEDLTADWVSWAVPRPDLDQVVRGALGLENRGLGYNPTFRYPVRGGIEALPAALAARLPALRTRAEVVEVDLTARTATLASGEVLPWDRLVSTIPLPRLLRLLRGAPDDLVRAADCLRWTAVYDLNLGLDQPDLAGGDHWVYFPEPDAPFYRVGCYSNISRGLVPEGAGALYVEFPVPPGGIPDVETLERQALEGLHRSGHLTGEERVLVRDLAVIDPAYVVFDAERARTVPAVLARLREAGILSIGRYGAWTYSFMERALEDGMEAARDLGGSS
jgi:protoporphyrinogen oxidase